MTDSDAEDRQVRELLGTLERDRTQIPGRRDEILQDVLAHYERSPQQADTEMVPLHPSSDTPPQRRSGLLWVASVAMVTLAAGLLLLAGHREGTTPADTTPATLDPTDMLTFANGLVSIDVPDGLSVVERQEGLVLIGSDATGTGVDDAIVIVEYDLPDFGAEMARLSAEGTTMSTLSGSNVDGRRFDRWSVAITEAGIADIDCPPDHDCLELVPGISATALKPGLRIGVVELVTSDGQKVLVMRDEDGPLGNSLTDLLAATTVE